MVVSPTGDDRGTGEDARPFKSIGRALAASATTIELMPGTYAENLWISRDVTLRARETATLAGRLSIQGAAVSLTSLDVTGGLAIDRAPRVALESLRVTTASTTDTITVVGSTVVLRGVTLACASETCLQAASSTVSADGLTLVRGVGDHKRGLRAETSSVTLRNLRAGGATNVDIQATTQSHLTIIDAELADIVGNAIAVQSGSTLECLRTRIFGQARTAILISASDAHLRHLDLGPLPPPASGIGVEGSTVVIENSRLYRAGSPALVVNDHRSRPADVRLDGVVIEHGRTTGINLGQGKLTLVRTDLVGDPSTTADGEDALVASGDTATLIIESATFDAAAGHAIGVYNNAGARIAARITRPRLGGILIERTAGSELRISGTTVSDCRSGSAVVVVDALGVEIEDVELSRCPEAGVLAGAGAEVTVRRARLVDNRQYGVAAFGRSTLTIGDSSARGSKWAAFASCADGSVISDGGANTFTGPVSLCP